MPDRHTLLDRQLKRHLPEERLAGKLESFVAAIDSAYREFDVDRAMLERSLDLSSKELLQANSEMRAAHDELEIRVQSRTAELSQANADLTNEIAERKRFEAELLHIASHDSLTDLYNRRHFEEELENELDVATKNGSVGALLFLDLDQFKVVNDTLGHSAGDELLKGIVELLQSCLREGDILARLGGDEFAVLLPNTRAADARAVGNRIEEVIRRQVFWLHEHPVHVTTSVGIALFPRLGETAADLLSKADLAMYQAKANGRSRVEVFYPNRDWRSLSESRLRWRNRIIDALEQDRFVLYAQPIQDLRSGAVRDYEILLRLPTSSGLKRPGGFMDIAEEFGLAPAIDKWVVQRAIQEIASQERAGNNIRLAVNLSGKSLADTDLLNFIRAQIAETSIDPSRLVPEITETAAIANFGQAHKFIRTLRQLGCHFSLDDFGSGFSSFNHLKQLPVDYLKIDGSFVKKLPRSEVDQHLVHAMVAVANGLGKQTIAEFVQDQTTSDLLSEYGVDYAQGYFIGRPRELAQALPRRLGKAA